MAISVGCQMHHVHRVIVASQNLFERSIFFEEFRLKYLCKLPKSQQLTQARGALAELILLQRIQKTQLLLTRHFQTCFLID